LSFRFGPAASGACGDPRKGVRMAVLIQYEGFIVSTHSRIYSFQVIDSPGKSRQFTVTIQLEAFRAAPFKFQDGPDICFARLKRELDGETQDAHAKPHLKIVEQDILQYSQLHPRARRL
jgi:hypothetical protein